MSKSIGPMLLLKSGARLFPASSRSHRSDEFAPAIPWRFALQHGPPPLRWPTSIFRQPKVICQPAPSGKINLDSKAPDKAKYQHPGWAKLEYRSGPCLSIEPTPWHLGERDAPYHVVSDRFPHPDSSVLIQNR